ncbi:MAG TPA: SurA N-terminal domain-containing protein [Desulfuromonadales bacterium]|nr:SurA N-terminal domain-containing protein [Desulfuromonadales bacterium]
MLDLIRKKQKSIIIKVVFWAIIATFVGTIFLVWGKGSDGDQQDTTVAVTVNKTRVGFDAYQSAYNNLYRLYQNVYREQFTPELEKQLRLQQQALDSLIEQTLLIEEAERLDLSVTQKELVAAIAAIPAFQENGAFSKERYLQVLNYQRLTPEEFENMQRRQILIERVRERIQSGISITDADIAEEHRQQNEKIDLAFVRLAPARFEEKVRIDEKSMADFFAGHREEFRIPESVALRYLVFEPSRFEKEVTFEEGELEKYYRRHLDRFDIPEQVRAAHILIRVAGDAGDMMRQQKRQLAEKILAEARSGKDFAQLARQHSEDPGSAAKGGDLGFFPRGAMVGPFEEAAFALKPGEISGIVETPFGLHIIKCEGRIEAGIRPLAEVGDEVKAALKTEKARQLALEKAMDAYNVNRKGGNLEAAAKASGLGVEETGFFGRQEPVEGLGDLPEVAAAAFTLKEGELARPVELPQGVILFTVKARRESRLPELAEVRAEVEQAYRREQAKMLARQAAEKLLAAVKAGGKLETLAGQQGESVERTGLFSRSYGVFVPKLGNAENLAKAAFTLTRMSSAAPEVYEIDETFVVAALADRQEAGQAGLTVAQKDELREALLTRKQEEALASRLKELREKAEISIAPALLSTLEGNKPS